MDGDSTRALKIYLVSHRCAVCLCSFMVLRIVSPSRGKIEFFLEKLQKRESHDEELSLIYKEKGERR